MPIAPLTIITALGAMLILTQAKLALAVLTTQAHMEAMATKVLMVAAVVMVVRAKAATDTSSTVAADVSLR